MLIEGVFAAIPTPFYLDERVYFRKLEANVARISRSQLAGIVVLGSTGEAPLLNDAESAEILRVAASAASPDKVLIAGVGRESVRGTVELAEQAAAAHYDAVLVRPPSYYNGFRKDLSLLQYFRSVADRSPLPVLLYNVPNCVPQEIPVQVVAELATHPNIIGIKDSGGSTDRIRAEVEATRTAPKRTVTVTATFEAVTERMLVPKPEVRDMIDSGFIAASTLSGGPVPLPVVDAVLPSATTRTRSREVGFQVLCGTASLLLDALEAGASGAIVAFAAFAPEAVQEIYLSWKAHDKELAIAKQQRVISPNRRIVSEMGLGAVKYACDFNGFFGGRPRSPLLAPTAIEKSEIEDLLSKIRN